MLSREVAENLVPEVSKLPAAEQDVGNSLLSLAALAAGASDPQHSSSKEKVA